MKDDPARPLVVLRGTAQYEQFLERLRQKAKLANRSELVEVALAHLGWHHGILAPRRCRPLGANQYGEPESD